MTSEKSPTSVRRRRIAGERSRPTERPAPQPKSRPAPSGGPPRGPGDVRSTAGWRPDRPTLAWFVPLCMLAFVAAGVAIGLVVLEARDGGGDQQDREDAVAPAGQAAEALLSFRYDTLEAELESERELMTDSYAEELRNVFPDQAQDLTSEQQATVESTVLAAAPLECGDECSSETVDVLLYLNTESAVRAEAPEVNPNRAVVTMNLEGDQWLVDGIELF